MFPIPSGTFKYEFIVKSFIYTGKLFTYKKSHIIQKKIYPKCLKWIEFRGKNAAYYFGVLVVLKSIRKSKKCLTPLQS